MGFQVWMDVYSLPVPGSGGKTCSQIFEEAGCDTPASPSCGACLGGPKDTYARMNEPQASNLLLSEHLVAIYSSLISTYITSILTTLKGYIFSYLQVPHTYTHVHSHTCMHTHIKLNCG